MNGEALYQARREGVPRLRAGELHERRRHLPHAPLGAQPRAVLPRPALLPLAPRPTRAACATTRRRAARPGADRAAVACAACSRRLVPSAARSPSRQQCLATIRDPNRDLPRRAQLNRFLRAIKHSTARFKVIMNELPIQQYYVAPVRPLGGLRGRAPAGAQLPAGNVKNVVFLTTDVHATLVNDARSRRSSPAARDSGILDITVGPAATANFELEIDGATEHRQRRRWSTTCSSRAPPPNGPGRAARS